MQHIRFNLQDTENMSSSTDIDATKDVGFANLPNCIDPTDFSFNMLLVGESGLGKSSFLNSFFESHLCTMEPYTPLELLQSDKPRIVSPRMKVTLKENGVDLALSVIETQGFGDFINNDGCWKPIVKEIETSLGNFMNEEARVQRTTTILDERIHCCLYFIAPSGHGLTALDIEAMKQLQDKVNLIPVIAKGDLLTSEEMDNFKTCIIRDIKKHEIEIYKFPGTSDDWAVSVDEGDKQVQVRLPFAVCGSEFLSNKDRVRKYPWGSVEVYNKEHSDFTALRKLLIRTHMHDMIEFTHVNHYEKFRSKQLSGMALKDTSDNDNQPSYKTPMEQFEAQKVLCEEMIVKKEKEMNTVFIEKFNEKKTQLTKLEADLLEQHEKMEIKLKQKQSILENKRREFEVEKAQFVADSPSKKGKDRTKRLFK
eukprot:m.4209 g.4209  ORF g.4209 m.4209 type:complete len:423 (-) comp2924_c0_seq1:50-1318(-)